jgi:hypothetical protein
MNQPDKCVLLKITSDQGVIYKLFATWFGGYIAGDYWRLNSGIAKVEPVEGLSVDAVDVIGDSGSVYRVVIDLEGTSAYTGSVLYNMIEKSADLGVTIEKLPLSALKTLNDVLQSANESPPKP